MIIPSCRCHHDDRPNSHHPSCLAIAEPQPLSPAQLSALSVVATRDILSRKTPNGSPLFPHLLAHLPVN